MKKLAHSGIFKNLSNFFSKEEDGVVAVIFAVMTIPVLALSGATIDYSQASNVKNQIQKASDAAALAAGRAAQTNDSESYLLAIAQDVFDDNMLNSGFFGDIDLDGSITALGYRVEVETQMKTNFLKLVGIENLSIAAATEVGVPQLVSQNPPPPPLPVAEENNNKLEVVMSYHISNTIDLANLKAGSKDLVQILNDGDRGDKVKIGLVPFYKYVNIGRNNTGSWLDRSNFIFSPNTSSDWVGCVGTRDGYYEVNDGGYTGTNKVRGMVEHSAYCGTGRGNEVVPLTNNTGSLISSIESMRKHNLNWANYTHFPVGLMWGWAVLSEGVPFTQGLPYAQENKKVMIFVNDRVQNRSHNTGQAGSWGQNVTAANTEAKNVCANAKAQGIIIYTIRYNNADALLKSTMDSCASPGKNYYVSTGSQLKTRLQSIAYELENFIEVDEVAPPPPPPPPVEGVYEGDLRILK